ncbi:MAG: AMP-binding protein [Planctomycetaceae bacterium]|nr:AMP-binding protein [Planctomycetaceae bacterium]
MAAKESQGERRRTASRQKLRTKNSALCSVGKKIDLQHTIETGLAALLADSNWNHRCGDEGIEQWQERLRSASGGIGIWTSGTTGSPQYVEHSAASLLRGIQGGVKHCQDVWGLTYAPGSYAFWQVILQAVYNRNPIVDLHQLGPAETLAKIKHHAVTHLSGTPTFFRRLDGAGPVSMSVQAVTVGGEPLDTRALAAIHRQFPSAKIRNVYASTQAGVLLTSNSDVFSVPDDRRSDIKVVDGQLFVADHLLGRGVPVEGSESERFYPTGDLVEIVAADSEEGSSPLSFRFVGRRSAVIHVGGTKVSPEVVEAAILDCLPQVQAARVYGVPNSVTGQLVACEVVLASDVKDLDSASFRRALQQSLPPAAIPRIVRPVSEIELTGSAKIRRRAED